MKLRMMICIGMLAMLTCPGMDLVKEGKPFSEIVVEENASGGTLLAARDLQLHLEKISGARLKIVTPDKARSKNLICVGESAVTRKAGYKMPAFKNSGYDILCKSDILVLTGPVSKFKAPKSPYEKDLHEKRRLSSLSAGSAYVEEDCGPMHAVSAFLERLGVRFYAPYEDGTIIPRRKTISVSDFRETRTAAFAKRIYCGKVRAHDPEGAIWFRRLKSGSCLKPAGILPLAAVLKQNARPEWAAENEHGRLLLTDDGCIFPRFTHPGFRQACVKFIRQVLDADPDMKELELVLPSLRGENDGRDLKTWRDWTKFPNNTVNCNIMTDFYKAVAGEVRKTHPDRLLTCHNLLPDPVFRKDLPANLKFHPHSLSAVSYANPDRGKPYFKMLADLYEWHGKFPMQQREWWNELECPATPRQGFWFMHALQQRRKGQRPYVSGILLDTASDRAANRLAEVPLTHLMYYVNSKLLWDPDLDLDRLLDEYCRLWFGPAAKEMKTFLVFQENLAAQQGSRAVSSLNKEFREADLEFSLELLARARQRTAPDSIYRRRVADIEKAFLPLKSYFAEPVPKTKRIVGKILPEKTVCDGNFSKYGKWHVIPGNQPGTRTEFSLAVTEDRILMLVGVRCYEPEMAKVKKAELPPDNPAFFDSDHFRIDFNVRGRNGFFAAVNPWGSFADGSADPNEISRTGSLTGWGFPPNHAWAKRYADRWEAEIAIQINGCGKLPDYGDPWEIDFTRVRRSNTSSRPSDTGAIRPEYRYDLVLPKVDSQNQPVTFYYRRIVQLPGTSPESVYVIKRAKGPVDLSSPWNGSQWKDIPEIRMAWEQIGPKSSGYRPDPRAKIQYDDQNIYVLYQVHDRYVRGNFKKDQNMVCLDSCMEFFIQPVKNGPYYNFECNCIGTLLLYEAVRQGTELKMKPMPPEELRQVKRFATLPRTLSGEIEKPVTWRLGLQIPISLFAKRNDIKLPLSGQVWYGNIYKCADWTSHPCWLMWKKNVTFHYPEGFGALIFE